MGQEHAENAGNELEELLSPFKSRRLSDYRRLAALSEALPRRAAADGPSADSAEFAALLAEYETLRQESMNSTNNRIQVLVFGAAAIAALVGGALTIDKPEERKLLIWALFSLAVPLTCVFILLVWLSEAIRAHRSGSFTAGQIEARINAMIGRLTLSWEAALWTGALPRDERWGPSMMALGMIGLVAALAPIFGLILGRTSPTPLWWPIVQVLPPYALLFASFVYAVRLMPRLKNTGIVSSPWKHEGDERE